MKRVLFFFLFFSSALIVSGQFRAEMVNKLSGDEQRWQVISDGVNYRYEFTQEGQPGIVIVRPEENKTFILRPEQKVYVVQPCDGMFSKMNDPVQAVRHFADWKSIEEKIAGHEEVMGYDCVKKEYIMTDDDGTKILTNVVYYSEKLNFPLMVIYGTDKMLRMKLTGIQKWKPEKGYFVVPEGYSEVDEKGRPMIPEPPPPQKWTTRKVQLPFQGEVKRGTQIVFSIDKEGKYKLLAENTTDKPAKMIRYSFMDGKELPAERQGPERVRTERLYPGEKSRDTYYWRAGQEIRIKVFEGTMKLDIRGE